MEKKKLWSDHLFRYFWYALAELMLVVAIYGVIFHEHFWAVWRKEGVAWILLAIVIVSGGDFLIFEYQKRERQKSSRLLEQKLEELIIGRPSRHVLLNPADEYYELAKQVNRLQSKQRQRNRRFEQQGRDYLTLLHSLKGGVAVFDQNKQLNLTNHVFRNELQSMIEPLGKPFYLIFLDAKLIALTEKVYQTKQDQHTLWYDRGRDSWFDVQFIYVPLSSSHYSVMVIFNDITNTKRLEQKQRDFMANASHELRTPLTAIQGFSETLLDGALADEATARDFLEIILAQSNHLKELIDDISALAKDDPQAELQLTQLQIADLCQQLLAGYTAQIEAKKLTVMLEIEPGLKVTTDRRYLQHIMTNLFQNAIRYNTLGGQIKIVAKKAETTWSLAVTNTGPAIKETDKAKIFDRFYRAESSHTTKGSGLGLSIVKESVQILRGKITVMSAENKPTCFEVTLPLDENYLKIKKDNEYYEKEIISFK